MTKYKDWFNQLEGYHLRSERFLGDLDLFAFYSVSGQDQKAKEFQKELAKWLEAAFDAGVQSEKENKQNN